MTDQEMGTAISCKKWCQVAGLIRSNISKVASLHVAVPLSFKIVATNNRKRYKLSNAMCTCACVEAAVCFADE